MTGIPDYTLGDTIDFKFTTRRFTTGAPFQLAGSPVISAYPDNSVTQITAGITLSVDFDSVTGLNNVRVVATSGNGYAAGSTYFLVITTGTVDSVSVVGEVVGAFSLGRSAAAADLANATDGLGALKTLIDAVDNFIDTEIADIQARLPAALVSGRMDASVGAMASNVLTAAALAADAGAEIADAVLDEALSGHATAGTLGKAVTDIEVDTNELQTDWANGGRLDLLIDAIKAKTDTLPVKLIKNTAFAGFTFVMRDTSGDPATGLTVTAERSLDGAAFGACANAVAEISDGAYKIDLAAADVNANDVLLKFTATGAKALFVKIVTQPAS